MAETRATPHSSATTVGAKQDTTGAKQDVVVTGRPMVKDEGTISVTYNPGPGDPKTTEIFGQQMKAGEAVDVPARHADKVRGNPYLSIKGEKTYGDEKPKDQEPEEQEEATFEENLARERREEYLQGRTHFASPPGEAERIARAQEQARELQEAEESDDKDAEGKASRAKTKAKH